MAIRISQCPLLAFELIDLITSILHIANGHEDVILNRGVEGAFIFSLYIRYFWHILTYSMQSLSMVIQKYPDLYICLVVICLLA